VNTSGDRDSGGSRRERALIVEDDVRLAPALKTMLTPLFAEVRVVDRAERCLELLVSWVPDLLVLDVCLPDGSAFDVLEHLKMCSPTPVVIAMSGMATATETFRLGQLGVRSYLTKPFGTQELEAALAAAEQAPDFRLQLRNMVGSRPVHSVEEEVRKQMLSEAIAQARGNRRQAARLLNVSRQLLQHMLRRSATFE
jgi:DNA-binding NtrC family response regulator